MEPRAEALATETAKAPVGAPDLRDPSLYENRELSWLDFNERVLELAGDEGTPLLERVKFLAIYASNLDEFYMVRVAGLHNQVDAGIDARGPDGLSPRETLQRIAHRVTELAARHTRAWEEAVRPELAEHGLRIVDCDRCDPGELARLDRIFRHQVFPVLTPLAVGLGRPFPYISNLSLSLAVSLRDPVTGEEVFARVKVPKEVLPRFVLLEEGVFVPLESLIARHLDQLFPGMEVLRHDLFRVTRDADFNVSDEADDLLQAVEDELRRRRFGEVVRLEVGTGMDRGLRQHLIDGLDADDDQVIATPGMLDAADLWELYELEGYGELRERPWQPVTPPGFADQEGEPADVFAALRSGDLLVHHPYDSFAGSVERFARQAVADPEVLAIKMTVYRTSDDSALVPALIDAADRGKQAVCLVELKARFDERRNIDWARALEEAGAHVMHGLPGLKIHAKAVLVVRGEGEGVRHYVHLGTGNYNAKTARLYEDFGFFTADPDIAADVAKLFNSLTGASRSPSYRKLLVSPDDMRARLLEEIARTMAAHEAGEPAWIGMKMNALVDEACIRALYEASQAGVPIELNVRGICCLRAGVPGVSDTIRVISVVGRFLEHSRIYAFHRGGERVCLIGSADLMPRNLDTRVELLAPIEDEHPRAQVEDTLRRCLEDDSFAWELGSEGSWRRRRGGERSVHRELMDLARREVG